MLCRGIEVLTNLSFVHQVISMNDLPEGPDHDKRDNHRKEIGLAAESLFSRIRLQTPVWR
jgi:hypothetical protein